MQKNRFILIWFFLAICSITVYSQEEHNPQSSHPFEQRNPLFAVNIGDAELAVRYQKGEGIPIIFVHGSWGDHNGYLSIANALAAEVRNPIILYDRRGHSASSPDIKQGSIAEDVSDALALMHTLGFDKVHFIGHSYGANIVVKLASEHPEAVGNILIYEPPMFGVLKGKPIYKAHLLTIKKSMVKAKTLLEKGEIEAGTVEFVENVAFGKDSWCTVFDDASRMIMLANYRTWLDQTRDPQRLEINPQQLNNLTGRVIIVYGTATLPIYKDVVTELDKVVEKKYIIAIEDAGHAGTSTHPEAMAKIIKQKLLN